MKAERDFQFYENLIREEQTNLCNEKLIHYLVNVKESIKKSIPNKQENDTRTS